MPFYSPAPPPPLHDDHGRPLKPSERFARPHGPVFLVDETGHNNHPAFTYSYNQPSQSPPYSSSSEQGSPYSTWSGGYQSPAGGALADSPATSTEENSFSFGQPKVNGSIYNHHWLASPLPPPKDVEPRNQPSYEQEQESRDQLSPLLSPGQLDYGRVNQVKPLDASNDAIIVGREEHNDPKSPESPPRGRSFFTFHRSPESPNSQSVPSKAVKTMKLQDGTADKRSSRSVTSGIVASLGRRSRSASRSSAAASSAPASRAAAPSSSAGAITSKWRTNPYGSQQVRTGNGMHSALQENWVNVPQYSDTQGTAGYNSQSNGQIYGSRQKIPLPPSIPAKPQRSPERQKQTFRSPVPDNVGQHTLPQTPSPVKSRHRALPNWKNKPSSPAVNTPPSPTSPSLATSPSKENSRSPTFFMRGRQALKKVSPGNRGISSADSHSPSAKVVTPFPVPASPPSMVGSSPARAAAAWPAESHVFGAAQAVIGNATIGPHVPEIKKPTPQSVIVKPSIVSPHPQDRHDGDDMKSSSQANETSLKASIYDDEIFSKTTAREYPVDTRKRVMDLLNIHQSRKSSLYTSSSSSVRTSGTGTPIPKRYGRGRPRVDEALLVYPESILASVFDHLSFRSFKRLLHSSPRIYRAAYNDQTGQSDMMEVVKQRYLASYGYRPLPRSLRMAKDNIKFTIRDLNAFQIGMEYSISEYSIFATEHKRKPLEIKITRLLRESTRSFNRLAFRLQAQDIYLSSLPNHSKVEEELKLIKPYWQNFKKVDYQNQLFQKGRCMLLRVWIPCETQWMTDLEVVEVEREVHRSGVWGLLRRGDLVRNLALGDIGNEGVLIFDGKYLRDLSYTHDTIGHLPSWLNSLSFSPSYFHNQVAASTSQPIVYLDLTQYHSAMQANLMLCKEKVDISSPSGEQYKVTRYVYRTVIELTTGSTVGGSGAGDYESIHPDWAGQLIIETDGTTEAAKELLQRVTPLSQDSNQANPPLHHLNNRPYTVLRHLSIPGLIFCRVVPDAGSRQ